MTQHEHGPLRDENEPSGFVAVIAFGCFIGLVLVLVGMLVFGA